MPAPFLFLMTGGEESGRAGARRRRRMAMTKKAGGAAYRKKLIEVALPLTDINDESAYDKMPGIGPHPKGIHHWWARLPLPAARAVLFASVVDDPGEHPEKWRTKEEQDAERERLFDILRRMMGKRLHESPEVYEEARAEMLKHCGGNLPAVLDPFAGGGSIPLEANRLGFTTHARDLNPVAVLLNKCNLEIAPRWKNRPPANSDDRSKIGGDAWKGLGGLAADIRYYGSRVHDAVSSKIGHLYPHVTLSDNGNRQAEVVAWIWARTVPSPNPAMHEAHVPLISTYWLSSKKAWLEPVIDAASSSYTFRVHNSAPPEGVSVGSGTKVGLGGFRCILSGAPIPSDYICKKALEGKLGRILLTTVVKGRRGLFYIEASSEQSDLARAHLPDDYPVTDLPEHALGISVNNYGFLQHWQMFTKRQLVAMVALSDSIRAIKSEIKKDAVTAGLSKEDAGDYATAVTTFLALALDRVADFNNAFNRWSSSNSKVMGLFSRPTMSMIWDFAEANTLGSAVGSWLTCIKHEADCVATILVGNETAATAHQADAVTGANGISDLIVSTDPPYYDNIGYAALSDFFYIWLRRTVGDLHKDLFSTVLTTKDRELTAEPARFEDDKTHAERKICAKEHFEEGFRNTFASLRESMDPRFPLTVYYAFKQGGGGQSKRKKAVPDQATGWETLLRSLITAGFQITATWPVRASQSSRMRAIKSNALASYIVLACRPRPDDTPTASDTQFRRELREALRPALDRLQQGGIALRDSGQAAIGPGMTVYSRYSRILNPNGEEMTVREALDIINQMLIEVEGEHGVEYDRDTQWAIAWFELNGFNEGEFGVAIDICRAKNTTMNRLRQAGIVEDGKGKARLLKPDELPGDWDPAEEKHFTVWRMTHQLIRLYHYKRAGDDVTGNLLREIGISRGEAAPHLARHLYRISERAKWSGATQAAQDYNALVSGWQGISEAARGPVKPAPRDPIL